MTRPYARYLTTLILVLGLNVTDAVNGQEQNSLIPSLWQGQIEGTVAGRNFRLPVSIELGPPLQGETNPFRISIAVEDQTVMGSVFLISSLEVQTPSGRPTTLQYVSFRGSGGSFQGSLVNDQANVAAVINQFVGPNLSAQNAPPVMKEIYGAFGTTELYAFRSGLRFTLGFQRGQITGALEGAGRGYINIFPSPDARYSARFAARRVR